MTLKRPWGQLLTNYDESRPTVQVPVDCMYRRFIYLNGLPMIEGRGFEFDAPYFRFEQRLYIGDSIMIPYVHDATVLMIVSVVDATVWVKDPVYFWESGLGPMGWR